MKKETYIGPAILIIIWYLVTLTKWINPLFLPSPIEVLIALYRILGTGKAWLDILLTTGRVGIGFLIAAIMGIPIGLLMGRYKKINATFSFVIDFFRSLPAIALFPLLMFFFGIGSTAMVLTAAFTCGLVVVINTIYGVLNSRRTRQIVAEVSGANRWEVFTRVIILDAVPHIFAGLRIGLSFAVIVIVATEMLIGNKGIGQRIVETQLTYRVPEMYSWICLAGLLGFCLNKGFLKLENRFIHWGGK